MTDIVAAIRARHLLCHCDIGAYEHCAYCGTPWPCDAARAVDEIEDVRKQLDVAFEMQREYVAERDALAARIAAAVDAYVGGRFAPAERAHEMYRALTEGDA